MTLEFKESLRWRPTFVDVRVGLNRLKYAQTLAGEILAATTIDVFLRKVGEWKAITGRLWQRLPKNRKVAAEIIEHSRKN